jgi:hypothetical protein
MTIPELFQVGQRVHFIVQNVLREGYVARELYDGATHRVEISTATGKRPIWALPAAQVAHAQPTPRGWDHV